MVIDDEKIRWWKDDKVLEHVYLVCLYNAVYMHRYMQEMRMKEITEIGRIPLKGVTVHLRHLKNAFGVAVRHTFRYGLDQPLTRAFFIET